VAEMIAKARPLGKALAGAQAKGFANDLVDESPLFGGYKGTIK